MALNITLINPPIDDFYITSIRRQPLGLLYIAGSLQEKGHTVTLINCHTPKKHPLPLPEEFSYLNEFINHPDPSLRFPFKQYYRFGYADQQIKTSIQNNPSDIYCVSSLFTPYYEETVDIIAMIKEFFPHAIIIAGGYHASMYPEYFLATIDIDFVVTGEGEHTTAALIDAIERNGSYDLIPNLAYKDGDKVIQTPKVRIGNLDRLAFPHRDLLKSRDFKVYKKRGIALVASRGCPNYCSFCTNRAVWGREYIDRSVDNIMCEIDACVRTYGINYVNFEDDNLFCDVTRSRELLQALAAYQKRNRISLDLTAMNGISIEKLDHEILYLMKLAGFREINVALVSYSRKTQQALGRPFDSVLFENIVTYAREILFHIRAYYILGLPQQTKDEIDRTVSFLQKLRINSFPSVYYNVQAPLHEWKMQRSSAFFNESPYLTRKDLLYYFNRMRTTLM